MKEEINKNENGSSADTSATTEDPTTNKSVTAVQIKNEGDASDDTPTTTETIVSGTEAEIENNGLVIITTYNVANMRNDRLFLKKLQFNYLVLGELSLINFMIIFFFFMINIMVSFIITLSMI